MENNAGLVGRIGKRLWDPGIGGMPVGRELTGKVQRDLLDLAYRNNWANNLVNLAAGASLVAMFWLRGDLVSGNVIWLAVVGIVSCIRLWSGYLYRLLRENISELPDALLRKWRFRYQTAVIFTGLLWSVLGLMQIPTVQGESQFLTMIILAGMAGGATGILAPVFLVGRIYLCALLLPPAVILAVMAEPNYILSALALVFLLVMLVTHRNNHAVLFRSFVLKYQNQGLIEDLRQKNRITEDWNATLEIRVEQRTEELRNLVEHDALTGLYNRDGIVAWFEHKKRSDALLDYAVLFIDLDRFKQINDGLSHAIGDEVLRAVSMRLGECVGPEHALGRWGGDEFLIVLAAPHLELHPLVEDVIELAQQAVTQPINIVGHTLHVGFSTGVAFSSGRNPSISELIHWADLAAAEVKRSGRGSVHNYDKMLLTEQERRLSVTQALRRAMGADEFDVKYQPVIDAVTGDIIVYEALLRWNSGVLGVVSPDEFIPIAEESALIVDIGEWCMRRACQALQDCAEVSATTKIAINVSIRQIVMPNFADMVSRVLADTGLSSDRLVLEVTESIFEKRQTTQIARVLDQLHAMGIEIYIDDFGTGYSSLSRLHEIPVDAVKIDKSFVLAMDENARVVIEAAILIAHRFGLKVIAEGIETAEQRTELLAMGVDACQGFFFARPGPMPCRDTQWQSDTDQPV
ncbi:EAL domain-containing protein [Thalassospira sp. HF15]|uniref:putative bifunctional diguanylate cyclase/phosphodiesterase n=1 Tax=Thalassospira sp. HF15 TaxID=2722755 RepID=UPI001431EB48|nr:GGDEF domain-containing phosphodiesterase [Thalassospira sp. HF15]NIY76510.1 EAL domain-containing protein [Thalassospira sp. HF15]